MTRGGVARPSAVRIAVLCPELLGTYGDGGNGIILEQRLRWRGIPVERLECSAGRPVPAEVDLYLLGGGEDRPQTLAARELRADGAVARGHARGAVIFAVCAGFQLLGHEFPGAEGAEPGLGLLDVVTSVGPGRRAVGELLVDLDPVMGLPQLTGFENHQGVTRLGSGARPLGRVVRGVGNGVPAAHDATAIEGATAERVLATYAHGPVLARNPALADHLLSLIVGPLEPLDFDEVDRLRAERLAAARGSRTWWRRGR
jgi:CobQ-like glutamine amidotransferase family enzyme